MSRFIFHNSRIRIHNTSYKNPALAGFLIADRNGQQFLERHPACLVASYSKITLYPI
jgi:hypothetical protein